MYPKIVLTFIMMQYITCMHMNETLSSLELHLPNNKDVFCRLNVMNSTENKLLLLALSHALVHECLHRNV